MARSRIPHLPTAHPFVLGALACVMLAFAFLGLRGIWDPDEGRYTNVALTMLDTGDWVNPKRSEEVGHWTKPPLTYWLLGTSLATFGHSPWAARLPIALSFLACMGLAGLCAQRLHPGAGPIAPIIYATMILPYMAGQFVSTDFPLAALQALAMYAYVERRFGADRLRFAWLLLMWAALGLGFMTKGPPALVPLLVIGLMAVLCPAPRIRWIWHATGVALFLAIALPWYLVVFNLHPGLLQYFLGAELVDRVASDRFGRNGQWYGWIAVYVPTLLLGTLPWTADLLRWARDLYPQVHQWRRKIDRVGEAPQVLLALWIVIPIVVFCFARSRLPLYLLPLFVPLAIAIAAQRLKMGKGFPKPRWLVIWMILLLATRFAGAMWPTHKDASLWAQAIRERVQGPIHEIVFVDDMARYGLHLHLGTEVEKVTRMQRTEARFNPEYDEPLMREVREVGYESGMVFVTKQELFPDIAATIHAHGYQVHAWGTPFLGRVIFGVTAPPHGTADTP